VSENTDLVKPVKALSKSNLLVDIRYYVCTWWIPGVG